MTITEKQEEIISEFELLDDWLDKYQLIIDKGISGKGIDPQYKTPENLIEGCQSKVWLMAEYKDGKVYYQAESNTDIAGGVAAMLVDTLSGHTPDEILNSDLYFIDRIGLKEHLSPTRANGMLSMIHQLKLYALAFKAKEKEKQGFSA
jgi:cysteine desulfuration protein SufE